MIGFILTIFFLHALAVSQQGDIQPVPQSEPIRNPAPQSEPPKVPQSEPPHNPAPQNIPPKTPEPPKVPQSGPPQVPQSEPPHVPQSEPPHNPAPQNIPKTPEPPKVPQSEPPHNPAPQNIPKNPEPPRVPQSVPQSEPPHNEPPKPAPHSEPPRVPGSEPPKVPQSEPPHNEPPKPAPHSEPPRVPGSEPPKVPQPEPPKPTTAKDIQQGKDNIEKDKTTITAEITAQVTVGETSSVGTTTTEVNGAVLVCSLVITFGADATEATKDKICQYWLASLKARTGFDFDGCSWVTNTKRQAGTTQTAVTSSKTTISAASGRVVSMLVIFVLSVLLLVF